MAIAHSHMNARTARRHGPPRGTANTNTQTSPTACAALKFDGRDGAFLIGDTRKTITLTEPGLRCLDVVDCPHLATLDLTGCRADLHLSVRGCPALSSIRLPRKAGSGRNAVLTDGSGASNGLTVTESWSQLRLTESAIERLNAPAIRELELVSCGVLRDVTVADNTAIFVVGATRAAGLGLERLHLDASALRHLAFAAREGDRDAGRLLGDWCGEATHRRGWLDALTVLAELAELGFDHAWL